MARYIVGVDLGESNDRSAVVVLQQQPTIQTERWDYVLDPQTKLPTGTKNTEPPVFHVVILDRFPVGMSYPDQVDAIHKLVTKQLRGGVDLVVDRTGVGAPVTDLMVKKGLRPIGITITAGETVGGGGGRISVPKRELVSSARGRLPDWPGQNPEGSSGDSGVGERVAAVQAQHQSRDQA